MWILFFVLHFFWIAYLAVPCIVAILSCIWLQFVTMNGDTLSALKRDIATIILFDDYITI